jgi:hypothetical protein
MFPNPSRLKNDLIQNLETCEYLQNSCCSLRQNISDYHAVTNKKSAINKYKTYVCDSYITIL